MTNAVITARLDADTLALVDRVSRAQGRSRSWFAARAIREAAEKEASFMAFVDEGWAAIERGDFVEQDEAEAMIEAMIAKHQARCD